MSDLRDLYQDVILDHSKRPRNYRKLADATYTAVGHNPLCGDKLAVYLQVTDGVVREATFQGDGCAISKASASMMTEAVHGKTVAEAEAIFESFQKLLTASCDAELPDEDMGKLEAFSGVREFPARVKCATLAWHTVHSALAGAREPISTE